MGLTPGAPVRMLFVTGCGARGVPGPSSASTDGEHSYLAHTATPSYRLIDDASSMAAALRQLRRARRIALDIEADSFHHYYEKTCLIQVTAAGVNYIIDPLADIDLSDFLALLARKPLILHDAGYDLRMLGASFNFRPGRPVFDTMLAARLLGIERFSLIALIEQFFGVALSKKGQKSDWSRRPLLAAQLTYAAQDTHYLEPLADHLANRLEQLGRTGWHRQWCDRLVETAGLPPRPKDPERWRIRGSTELEPRQLAFLHAVWHWRETEARKVDRPPFMIIGNDGLVKLALWAAEHPAAPLEEGPKLPRHCNGRRFGRLRDALHKADALKADQWPGPRRVRPRPQGLGDIRKQADRHLVHCRRIARDLKIAADVLASRAAIEAITRAKPTSAEELARAGNLMPWQVTLLEDVFLPVSGKSQA